MKSQSIKAHKTTAKALLKGHFILRSIIRLAFRSLLRDLFIEMLRCCINVSHIKGNRIKVHELSFAKNAKIYARTTPKLNDDYVIFQFFLQYQI